MSIKIAWRPWIDLTPLIKTDEGLDIELLKPNGIKALGGRFQELVYCSEFIWAKPDERLASLRGRPFTGTLNWISKWLEWNEHIILFPQGHPDTRFAICYYNDEMNECRVFPRLRKVKEGPFKMRRGPSELCFFIAGEAPVKLFNHGYIRADHDLPRNMASPSMDIY